MKKGWQKPGHKYLYRIPLPAGGYRYFYKHPTTRVVSHEDFRLKDSKFHDEDENFKKTQSESIKEYVFLSKEDQYQKKFKTEINTNFNAFYGRLWEIFATIPDVENLDDALMKIRYYQDTYKDSYHQNILKDLSNRIIALNESEYSNHIERLINDNGKFWNYIRKVSPEYNISEKNIRVVSTAHIQRRDMVSDLHIIDASESDKNNDLGLMVVDLNSGNVGAIGISSKAFLGTNPVTLKNLSTNSFIENFSGSSEVLRKGGATLKRVSDEAIIDARSLSKKFHSETQKRIDELKKIGAHKFYEYIKKKSPEASKLTLDQIKAAEEYRSLTKRIGNDQNIFRSKKVQASFFNLLENKEFSKKFVDDLYNIFANAFTDNTVSELFMMMPFFDERNKTDNLFMIKESKLRKDLKKYMSEGNFSISMARTSKKEVLGKSLDSFSQLRIYVNKDGEKVNLGQIRFRENEFKTYIQLDHRFMKSYAVNNNDYDSFFKELEKRGINRIKKSTLSDLLKAIATAQARTTSRIRPNSKYIRKEITPSGGIRYIYKETQKREKKMEEPYKDSFISKIDSSSEEWENHFKDIVNEISEEHFRNINAGSSAIKITNDSESYFTFLRATDEQRNDRRFSSSWGTYGIMSGKMAFNSASVPAGVTETAKKVAMSHEIGHSFFYGTLRMKHNKPLSSASVGEGDTKKEFKDSFKFLDDFMKYSEETVTALAEEVKSQNVGKNKEQMILQRLNEVLVSNYCASGGEEHFAEVFAYYHLFPERLKNKEPQAYKIFNEYFKKY